MLSRNLTSVLVFLLVGLLGHRRAYAEILPETGTFEGIYHCDRWGVGRFKFFVVEKELHDQFAPYEGKRIRVHVTEGIQRINPGPAYMQKVGSIVPLVDPPLGIRVEFVPPRPAPKEPFQLICRFENRGEKKCFVATNGVQIHIRCQAAKEGSKEFSPLSYRGWSDNAAKYEWSPYADRQMVLNAYSGAGHLAPADYIELGSGESCPMVVQFDKGLPLAGYEIEVTARSSDERSGATEVRSTVWMAHDVQAATREYKPSQSLRIASKSLRTLRDYYELQLKLVAPPGEIRSIAVPAGNSRRTWAGRLRGFTADNRELEIRNNQASLSSGPWHLERIPDTGHAVKLEFRQQLRFSGAGIDRIVLDLLTDRGVESYEVAKGFRDVHAVLDLPPFGETVQGVKLRARPAGKSFRVGQPLRFHMQAVNENKVRTGVSENIPCDGSAPAALDISVEIDGKEVELPPGHDKYRHRWNDFERRYEWTYALPTSLQVAPGKHTFRFSIVSSESDDPSSRQSNALKGKLSSNTVEFRVVK